MNPMPHLPSPGPNPEPEEEVEVFEQVRLVADAVIFGEHDGSVHVLLIERRWEPFQHCWALPGGHANPREEMIDACRRELAEETGLQVEHLTPVNTYAAVGRDPRPARYVTFAFTARVQGLPAPTASDDAIRAGWFPVHEALREVPLAFDHAEIITDAYRMLAAPGRSQTGAAQGPPPCCS